MLIFPITLKRWVKKMRSPLLLMAPAISQLHPHFRKYLKEFEFYDIFLADLDTRDIIYSVYKEHDYTTSLKDRPYANSRLGEAFRKANASSEVDTVHLTDFAPYAQSYMDPAAFISSPSFDGKRIVSALIIQMPVDRVNEMMSYSG
tara:strand:- start:409 stop:846 length:438 start_codon:yes stop_codon:yes gene_type:complete